MRTRRQLIVAGVAALLLIALGSLALQRWPTPANAAVGDASCDGHVNAVDATVVLQLTAGLIKSIGCPQNADTDGNGSIGPVDATLILQFVAGLIPSLEPPATATPTRTPAATPTPTASAAPPATATPGGTPTATGTAPPTATNTAPATNTPTATPAASATATFTPTRTPTPLSTVHVRNWSWYIEDASGDIAVVGEVYNGLSNNVAFVNVEATAFSATGQVLATSDPLPTCVSSVARHTDTPFIADILQLPEAAVVDHVQVSVVPSNDNNFGYVVLPEPGYDPPVAGILVDNVDSIREPDDTQHVSGEIVNQSSNTYDGGLVCIALYDATGTVVRVDIGFPEDDPLGPGAPTTFDAFLDVVGIPQDEPLTARVWFDAFYD